MFIIYKLLNKISCFDVELPSRLTNFGFIAKFNPFTNEFQLHVKGHFGYSIFTMEGIEIEQGKGENVLTIGSQLNVGFYVLKIESASGNKMIKISKN